MDCLWVLGVYNHVFHFSCHDSWKREVHKAQKDAYSAFPNDPWEDNHLSALYAFQMLLAERENMKIAVAS